MDVDGLRAASGGAQVNWKEIVAQTYGLAVECLQINYYGAKKMIEAFLPLLQFSQSPRIVNVSSSMGLLKVYSFTALNFDHIKVNISHFTRFNKCLWYDFILLDYL